jgi:hypothetical protein
MTFEGVFPFLFNLGSHSQCVLVMKHWSDETASESDFLKVRSVKVEGFHSFGVRTLLSPICSVELEDSGVI